MTGVQTCALPISHKRHDNHNSQAGAFLGGLVLGAIASDHHSDRRHHRYHRKEYRTYYDEPIYERNRYGECFRVEYRSHGRKVYIEVPRYKCEARYW